MFFDTFEGTELCLNTEDPTDSCEITEGILVASERDERANDASDEAAEEAPDIVDSTDPA